MCLNCGVVEAVNLVFVELSGVEKTLLGSNKAVLTKA